MAWRLVVGGRAAAPPAVVPGESGPGITVEVLNATSVDGLAREVARRLRRQGIDVVYIGSGPPGALDSTRIVIRRGDTSVAGPIRDALGTGRVSVDLDPRLLLDASVLVGLDLAPPAEHLRP